MYPLLNEPRKLKIQKNDYYVYLFINKQEVPISINETAFEILKLCNGINSIEYIKNELRIKYKESEENVDNFVSKFIEDSIKISTIKLLNTKVKKKILVFGSLDYFTPDGIILEITRKCPLNCRHCFMNANMSKNNKHMNREKLFSVCDEIIKLGIDRIQLTGGEPLLHPDFSFILDRLLKANINISITTSGFYINDEIRGVLRRFAKPGNLIQVSLDGLSITHNEIRGNEKSFEKAINFIKEMLAYKINISVASSYMGQSLKEIEKLCLMLRKMGISQYKIGPLFDEGRAKKNKLYEQDNDFEEYSYVLNHLKKFETEKFKVTDTEEMDKNLINVNCGAGTRLLSISPELDVFPCSVLKIPLGNLRDNKLIEIIKKPKIDFSNIICPSKAICEDCEYMQQCQNCMAQGTINSSKVDFCKWKESCTDIKMFI